jgi:ribosomal protein S27AE
MGVGGWWAGLAARRAERAARRLARRWRIRLTGQTCRRCGAYAFMPAAGDRLCGGCRSLRK